jgi:tetratricopeptide (TPR) repeat protein
MRTTAVSVVLVTAIATGCATGSAPRSAPEVGLGQPAPRSAASDPRAGNARAHELSEQGRAALAGGDAAAAASSLREAVRLQPDLVDARESLGLALYQMGDLDGAIEELRALLRRHPDAIRARLTLATALMARQDWAAARSELDQVLRRQPDQIQALYGLGLVRYARGDQNGAIDAYRQVLARSPDHADARYNLALVLKLSHRDAEATPEFVAAASAGHARAQYFAGTAYARGLGVERDLSRAIAWWSRAAAQGNTEANAALAELRQTALGKTRRPAVDRAAAEQAFRDYRAALWNEFPELELARGVDDDPVGAALLRQGRGAEAVPILILEARAFSEPAQTLLEDLYQHGVPGQLPAYDARILDYFKTAADEGQVRARQFLQKISAASEAVPPSPVRP